MRVVSVLEVAHPGLWGELQAMAPVDDHLGEVLGPTRRVVLDSFEAEVLPTLQTRGAQVLMRYAKRDAEAIEASRDDLRRRIENLPHRARTVLHRAQRHALDDIVIGAAAWDPVEEATWVHVLHGAGLIEAMPGNSGTRTGRYRLHPDLSPAPDIDYDFDEALMPVTDDLRPARAGVVGLLHDLASLAAALCHLTPRRTHAGTLDKVTARRLGKRLGSDTLAKDGSLAAVPRWERALRALEALGAVEMDPLTRTLHLDRHIETVIEGTTRQAADRLVHRLVDRDLHMVLPAVRAAVHQAGDQAIDTLIFFELLADQHRDVLFTPYWREGAEVYPGDDAPWRPFDQDSFEIIEVPAIEEVLRTLERLGMIRRADGVFAATEDGKLWAGCPRPEPPPVWITSDLELIVGPESITPWERFQLERLGRCLSRDVVDRYRLERKGMVSWLATHRVDDAIDLLRRRSKAVPSTVVDTLRHWATSAQRYVITRGVLLDDPTCRTNAAPTAVTATTEPRRS